ncbi:phasin family protein [Parachitinimonas caeni]|uniref:Phasin family protein n=1 Tax=Parachitinimonas caeni TaxID=3031301 RepID=A0ABT7DV87_9NEIS|nr:phasin family protein [Parachitinimonas caeni]MDK2123744.1 phasin family protein [Parachitinimonas caeni]
MFNATEFASVGQANFEKSLRISNIAISGMERLFNLQVELTRKVLEENALAVKQLSEVRDVQGLISLQQQLSQPAVDKAIGVARSVYESAQATQAELSQLIEEQVLEFNKNMVSTLDRAVKSAPVGSEAAVATLKTAVAAAASAYDTVMKTAKKVGTDIAEASVAAAETSAKAASAVRAPAVKKAATA